MVVEGKAHSTGKQVFEAQNQSLVSGACDTNLQPQNYDLADKTVSGPHRPLPSKQKVILLYLGPLSLICNSRIPISPIKRIQTLVAISPLSFFFLVCLCLLRGHTLSYALILLHTAQKTMPVTLTFTSSSPATFTFSKKSWISKYLWRMW